MFMRTYLPSREMWSPSLVWVFWLQIANEPHKLWIWSLRMTKREFSRVSTGDSDIPSSLRWNTSLNLSHCKETQPSFESGLSRYIPLETESRVPLTYLLLRENSTWGSCDKLAHLFSLRQGISSHLETICGARNFLHAAVLKWIFI